MLKSEKRVYHIITYSDRLNIECLLSQGVSKTKIAKELGVARQSLHREIKRGTKEGAYKASYAQTLVNSPKNAN